MTTTNHTTTALALAALAGLAITVGSASAANVIVNGDFETGDLTSWTQSGSSTSIDSTTPLAGSNSALQVPGSGSLAQSFTPFTGAATTSFIYRAGIEIRRKIETMAGRQGTRRIRALRGTRGET